MDKQKSYGKKYSTLRLKRKLSFKFVGTTLFFCAVAIVFCLVFVGD